MTRVTGSVLAQPDRLQRARALAGGVLDVIADPLAAWSSIPDGSTHHFLLQDDMVLSSTFYERVQNAAKTIPDAALALFAFWDSRNGAAVRQGALSGARWVPAANEYLPGAALMLPRDVAHGYVEYAREHSGTWPDDVLMNRFLKHEGIAAYVAVPSLVEHEDLAGLVGNNFHPLRRSSCFFAEDPSVGEHPDLLDLSAIPFFERGVAQCAVRMPNGWRTILCEEYLRRFDIPPGDLPARSEFDSPAHWGVWLTAFTMGVINRFEGHDVSKSGLVLDRALETIGPGGLCHRLDGKALTELTATLHALAWDGLRFGMGMSPTPHDRPSPSVRVACGNSFLGEYLLYTLADRGYHVTKDAAADVVVYLAEDPLPAANGAKQAVCLSRLTAEAESQLPDVPTCVLRLGAPYGPGMPAGEPVARFVRDALLNRPIDLDSTEPCQLVHVKDIADAVEAALTADPPHRIYRIANRDLTSPAELCVAIGRAVQPAQTEGSGQTDAPVVPIDLAEQELGWRQSIDLDYGLHTYAQWLAYETND
jgi:hypothetical protein